MTTIPVSAKHTAAARSASSEPSGTPAPSPSRKITAIPATANTPPNSPSHRNRSCRWASANANVSSGTVARNTAPSPADTRCRPQYANANAAPNPKTP